MITYMIHIHNNFEQARLLLRSIYHADNWYVIILDPTTNEDANVFRKSNMPENVHFIYGYPCVWGGASIVATTLFGMRYALHNFLNWDYFINLSGSDIPLITQEGILFELLERKKAGVTNFISDFGTRAYTPFELSNEEDIEFKVEHHRSDLTLRLMGPVGELFKSESENPIINPTNRIRVFVSEDPMRKELTIRPLYHEESRLRLIQFEEQEYRFGRQWFIFDRSVAEFCSRSIEAAALFERIKHVLIPDECFFQMILRARKSCPENVCFSRNFRFNLGEPYAISDENMQDVFSSGEFFARKFQIGPHTMKTLDRVLSLAHKDVEAIPFLQRAEIE